MLPEPDWDEIRAISKRAEELHKSGLMDRDTWRRLLAEAFQAAKGNPEFTSFLGAYAKGAWVHELREEEAEYRRSVAAKRRRRQAVTH
jgi:hypothetical protein